DRENPLDGSRFAGDSVGESLPHFAPTRDCRRRRARFMKGKRAGEIESPAPGGATAMDSTLTPTAPAEPTAPPAPAGLVEPAAPTAPPAPSPSAVAAGDRAVLLAAFRAVRALSLDLCRPLRAEDYRVQSMPDVSPPWWNLGHTSWFFAKNILEPFGRYRAEDARLEYALNSYYAPLGPRLPPH